MTLSLTEAQRKKLLAKLSTEPSDTKLSNEFGISRKTIWRMRQALKDNNSGKTRLPVTPSESQVMPIVRIPDPIPTPSEVAPPVVAAPVQVAKKVEDPRPKVDVEPVVLSTYFAVQILRGESYKSVAHVVLREADTKGILFRKLQVLDITSVGTVAFVRFRSDLPNADAVVRGLSDRSSITELGGSYIARFTNGKQGRFSTTAILSAPKVGFGQVYAGTRIKRWAQQFAA